MRLFTDGNNALPAKAVYRNVIPKTVDKCTQNKEDTHTTRKL